MLKKAYGGCRSGWELNIHGKDQEREEEAQRNSFKARKTLWLLALDLQLPELRENKFLFMPPSLCRFVTAALLTGKLLNRLDFLDYLLSPTDTLHTTFRSVTHILLTSEIGTASNI